MQLGPYQMTAISNEKRFPRRALALGLDDDFRRGFIALIPLWPGVIAFAVAFAIAAQTAGFTTLEVIALSLFVFAGSAQVATVALYASGAGIISIVLTSLLLNVRHTFYGLTINRWLPERSHPPKPFLAFFLTDESFGITIRSFLAGTGSAAYLFGASISLWISFVSSTIAGALIGGALPATDSIGLEFIFPLTFIALLIPLLRTRIDIAVAGLAGVLMYLFDGLVADGLSIVLVIAIAAFVGLLLDSRWPKATG